MALIRSHILIFSNHDVFCPIVLCADAYLRQDLFLQKVSFKLFLANSLHSDNISIKNHRSYSLTWQVLSIFKAKGSLVSGITDLSIFMPAMVLKAVPTFVCRKFIFPVSQFIYNIRVHQITEMPRQPNGKECKIIHLYFSVASEFSS